MATFGSMVSEVSRKLAGFTLRQDRQTHLVDAITTTSTTLKLASTQNISVGVIQINDELMYIDNFDRSSNTVTVAPYGRGYDGTDIKSHPANSRVVIAPTFPSLDIKNAINETVLAVFPDLYATGTHTFQFVASTQTYALPDEAESILGISYESVGPSKEWIPIRDWRMDPMASTASFNSRNSVTIYAPVVSGRTVQVFYSTEPTVMDSDSDDFGIVTGLPESAKDVIIYGATHSLISYVDPGRLSFGSAEADQQSQIAGRSYGAGTAASKYLLALYERRLGQESKKLQGRNPIRVHRTR